LIGGKILLVGGKILLVGDKILFNDNNVYIIVTSININYYIIFI
jgi:hypothetical protein